MSPEQRARDAKVEFKLAQERAKLLEEQRKAVEDAENARRAEHYQKRLEEVMSEGKRRFSDFEEVVNGTRFPPEVARDLLDSDRGVDIAYYLGNNIGELRKVARMSPEQRARMMGRLEERFSARASAGKKRTRAPQTPAKGNRKGNGSRNVSKYGPDDQDAFDRAFFES
jgi:hypothetical protein